MRQIYALLCVFTFLSLPQLFAANYCVPPYANSGSNSIYFHTISLGDLRDTAISAHDDTQYLDYSSAVAVDTTYYLVTTELIRGKNQNLNVNNSSTNCSFSAWIDYNENGSFEDQDEKLGIAYCQDTVGQIQFHIPAWVVPGDKRLRIALTSEDPNLGRRFDFLPCSPNNPAVGQTIDYTIEIHADYCFPVLTSVCDTNFMIDGIELNTMDNLGNGKDTSACHSDFSNDPSKLAELVRGQNDSLKIHLKNLLFPHAFVNLWIDDDDDGEYESYETPLSNLQIQVNTTLDTVLNYPVFPVPNQTGYKRMRVQVSNNSITNGYEDEACNPFASGEYEDYLLYIGTTVCTPVNPNSPSNGVYVNAVTMDAFSASANSGGTNHFTDYYHTPLSFVSLTPNKNHSLTVQTVNGSGNTVYVQAFADFNNDGFFDPESPSENLILNFNGQKYLTHQTAAALDVITFRSPSILTAGPVHLRILVADSTQEYFCGTGQLMTNGEIEDYKMIIENDDSLSPIADVIPRFGQGSYTNGAHEFCPGYVQFYDASYHHPDQWHWEFPGGLPSTSDVQNPLIYYDSAGYHSVKLRVSNSFGVDSVTLNNLIYINANAIHFRDVTGAILKDTIVICSTDTMFYINAADNPYFQAYSWNTGSVDTAIFVDAAGLPDTNMIYLTVETRTVPSCHVTDSVFVIQNAPLQIDLSTSAGSNNVCANSSLIETLQCTNTNALLGTYQFSYHINSGNSIQLPSSDPGLNVLTDTIDLSSNAGSTVTYLCSYHSFSGTQSNYGCSNIADSVTLNVFAQPSSSIHAVDSGLYCINGRVEFVAVRNGGSGNSGYSWFSSGGTQVFQNIDSLVIDDNSVVAGDLSVQYIFTTSDPGCIPDTSTYVEHLHALPQIQISTSVDSICNNQSLTLSALLNSSTGNGTPGGSYAWSWSTDQGNNWINLGAGSDTFYTNTFYIPGLSGFDSTAQVRVQYNGSQFLLGCNSGFSAGTFVLRAAPDVTNTILLDTLCSGNLLSTPITLNANIPGCTYSWTFNSGLNVNVTNSSGTTAVVNPSFANSGLLQDTTILFVTATGPGATACPGITKPVARIVVNPIPPVPIVLTDDTIVCSGEKNVLFRLNSMDGLHYSWSFISNGLDTFISPSPGNFAMFSFDQVSVLTEDTIHVTSQYSFAENCPSKDSIIIVSIKPESAPSNDIMVKMQPLHQTLVCLFNDADAYQWGYDSIPEITDHELVGQKFQSCSLGDSFDPQNFHYWVRVTQGGCTSKYYFVGNNNEYPVPYIRNIFLDQVSIPGTHVTVYPNPSSGVFSISMKGFTGTNALVEIYNVLGERVHSQSLNLDANPDYLLPYRGNKLESGIYFLRIQTSQEESALVSFIIE